ncbi:hypothetical protein ACFL2R_03790 [Patescibacteria group bacterium]
MLRKLLLVLLMACIGALILSALISQGYLPATETIYVGVPIFGLFGALAWWEK